MKKFMQKKLNQKGLTLVELLAVIVILGIIAAIAVPAIGNIITNSKVNALKSDGQNVLSAAQMYFAENGEKSVDLTKLTTEGFLNEVGGLTSATVTKVDGGSNTLVGTATTKGVTVTFKGSTSKNITDAAVKGTTGTVEVTR
ncbi:MULTISPECIES: type II secretion system protein [unclassified Sporosarcina]|uniref:type II secretion system protein n=1 Tax=unclassified Sporosarcina TaxID=2647733 RepID=UPI000C16E784|nr:MULTISPECIES: type II secretion system protein [unclassified Sporosarcina]PID04122.1 Tfp assembly type protein [Sporosarcina sp. P2]PID24648.1 Tfp assembly type protein [Sporosarcina sp. P7]